MEEVHGNIPAQADAAQAMYPAVHSLVLAMTENDLEYAPEDSEFLWTSLYYMLSLYGQMDERAELTDDTLILPSEMVRDYAAALYPQVEQLPGIPSPISQRILTGQPNALEDGSVLRDFQVTLSPRDSMFGYVITDLT